MALLNLTQLAWAHRSSLSRPLCRAFHPPADRHSHPAWCPLQTEVLHSLTQVCACPLPSRVGLGGTGRPQLSPVGHNPCPGCRAAGSGRGPPKGCLLRDRPPPTRPWRGPSAPRRVLSRHRDPRSPLRSPRTRAPHPSTPGAAPWDAHPKKGGQRGRAHPSPSAEGAFQPPVPPGSAVFVHPSMACSPVDF